MNLTTHLSLQATLLALLTALTKYGDALNGIIPAKYQPYLQLVIGLAMSGLAWYNHYYNPDGSPATQAYVKKPA